MVDAQLATSIFTDEEGNGIIECKQYPSIYRFLLPWFNETIGKTSTKVGYTVQPVPKRTGQWKKMGGIYSDLSYVEQIQASFKSNTGETVYYMDHAIHILLQRDNFGKVTGISGIKNQFPGEHISEELFYKKSNNYSIEITKADLERHNTELQRIYNSGDYQGIKFYKDFRESPIANFVHFSPTVDFEPRNFQQNFINNSFSYYIKNFEENPGVELNYLLSAPTRSGKSFMSASLSLELVEYLTKKVKKNNLILVVSGIADVGTEWQETYEAHKKFNQKDKENKGSTKIDYITRNELMIDGVDAIQEAYDNGAENVVVFLTLQDLNGSFSGSKNKDFTAHDFLKPDENGNSPVDFMIVDEAHFAAFNQYGEYRRMIAKTDFQKTKKSSDDGLTIMEEKEFNNAVNEFKSIVPTIGTLFVSATPYNELIGGSSFSVAKGNMTIISKQDIQKESIAWIEENPDAKEWASPYYGIPDVYNFAVDTGGNINEILEVEKESGDFIQKESANSMIWNFFGYKYKNKQLFPMIVSDPVYIDAGLGKHIIITVPSCAAADAVEQSLNNLSQTFDDFDYRVMNVSSSDGSHVYRTKSAYEIKKEISECEKDNQKTVVITVDRLTTGVTVKEWDTVVFWRNMSSAQKFDQFKGRNGTPYVVSMIDGEETIDENGNVVKPDIIKRVEKQNVAVVSYAPEQMLEITFQTAVTMARVKQEEGTSEALPDIIEKELKVSPTYVLTGGDHMVKMNANNILDSVLSAQKGLGPREYAEKVALNFDGLNDNLDLLNKIDQIDSTKSNLSIKVEAFENEPIPEGKCQFVRGCEKTPQETLFGKYSGIFCRKHLIQKIKMDEQSENDDSNKIDPNEIVEGGITEEELDEAENTIRKETKDRETKVRNYISVLLMFVALSDDNERSLDDIIDNLDNKDNTNGKRIAKNLGIDVEFLKELRDSGAFNYTLDAQIYLINETLNGVDENSEIDEIWSSLDILIKGFGNFSNNEIPTPINVAELVVDGLELNSFDYEKFNNYGVRVIDNGCKSAVMLVEFAKRAFENGVDPSKLKLFSVPTSPATYELIRKVYELMGWDLNNIYFTPGVSNLDMLTFLETSIELQLGCQREIQDDCPFHGNNKIAKDKRLKLESIITFPTVKNSSKVEKMHKIEKFAKKVTEKTIDNIIDRISNIDDSANARIFWEKLVTEIEKFDYAISNPPYQLDKTNGGDNNTAENIFHHFYNNSYIISDHLSMIFPGGRWMQRSTRGNEAAVAIFPTVSSIEWFPNGDEKGIQKIFPGIRISDGVSIVTAKNGIISKNILVNSVPILRPDQIGIVPLSGGIASIFEKSQQKYKRSIIHRKLSRAIFGLPSYYSERFPDNVVSIEKDNSCLLDPIKAMIANEAPGTAKKVKEFWIGKNHIKWNEDNTKIYNNYKVCASDGATAKNPELATYRVVNSKYVIGESWRVVGSFETSTEAYNYKKYIDTSFVRRLLAESKGGKNKTWGYFVPDLEDYTDNNPDINWMEPLDQQLYNLFNLTEDEIKVIEER